MSGRGVDARVVVERCEVVAAPKLERRKAPTRAIDPVAAIAAAAAAMDVAPTNHLLSTQQVPLLLTSARKHRRACCCRCLCYSALFLVAFLLGSASTTFYFVARDLLNSGSNSSAVANTCPGVCANRALHGRYTANVSATKKVGPVTIIVKFGVIHAFDDPSKTVEVRVTPIDFEPHWLPAGFKPLHCLGVPFGLGDDCNVTMMNDCTRKAYAQDDIAAFDLTWDPAADAIQASETVDTGFFTQTFVWSELRNDL